MGTLLNPMFFSPARGPCNALTSLHKPDAVLITGSTGALSALQEVLGTIQHLPVPILVAIHTPVEARDTLAQVLMPARPTDFCLPKPKGSKRIGVCTARTGHPFEKGEGDEVRVRLHEQNAPSALAPSGDRFLISAAHVFGYPLAVILSGYGNDGYKAASLYTKKDFPVLIQEPASAAQPEIPLSIASAAPRAPLMSVRGIARTVHQAFYLGTFFFGGATIA